MADDEWRPFSLQTSTRPTRQYAYRPTGSVKPVDADDQAPIPLLVAIALALFIGFVIIVFCICRRHNLFGGSSSPPDSSLAYQRAPTADGVTGGGGVNVGLGGNSYPMMSVKPMYPPVSQGQPAIGLPGKGIPGGLMMPPPQQPVQHQYPSLAPDAYTPPYPIGYAPLPSYMPTGQSSQTSTASGPSSDNAPSGCASPPPPPAQGELTTGSGGDPPVPNTSVPGPQSLPVGSQVKAEELESGAMYTPVATPGQGQMWYAMQAQGQGSGVMGRGAVGQGGGFSAQDVDTGSRVERSGVPFTPNMHPTAMDYMPGVGGPVRVESPHPTSDTILTQLDQL